MKCRPCQGSGIVAGAGEYTTAECPACRGNGQVPNSDAPADVAGELKKQGWDGTQGDQ